METIERRMVTVVRMVKKMASEGEVRSFLFCDAELLHISSDDHIVDEVSAGHCHGDILLHVRFP